MISTTISEPLCHLTEVEKSYGSHSAPVLGPLSLDIHAGQVLGIRGPNGAGKSTLLNLLAGVLTPDRGTVTYAPGVRDHIGYVPQELSLYNVLTGLDNLRFWGLACGLPSKAISTRSRWLLEQMELTEKAKKPVSTYSGGMKRRLHLASALMVTPRLLLLDEPTVGADSRSTRLILDTLTHLRTLGCGVVLISHQAGELEQVCQSILTLRDGRISEGGQVP
ncbi:ABC transporter ATP-binding protein [Pseudoflavonifractor sp. AF19-9AC]|uniref:ABC transporter ATP-binding protein n=1 Tax=Pseudoflavonifractor sp. AF19-9AC TaxID=2292244 RepID=UPI000E4AF823|nr:ABC transporter ATP-binding protein [Pseudoflavonifractor sp. AF19-9AC]RHR07440.1 ABC transporter ATP-binding protein [Pseudoflavonifractor sp. AF19-9AC]